MSPTTTKRPRPGWKPVGDAAADGHSKQTRWIPGDGQAGALTAAAEARGVKPGTQRAWKRSELLREMVEWGLSRTVTAVRAQGAVPAVHDSAPLAEKSCTVILQAGGQAKLDKQAAKVGVKRNELLRRHAAAWLAMERHRLMFGVDPE